MSGSTPRTAEDSLWIGTNFPVGFALYDRIRHALAKAGRNDPPVHFLPSSPNRPYLPWETSSVGGVIGFYVDPAHLPAGRKDLPHLLTSNTHAAPGFRRVVSDDRLIGRLAAEHLAEAGATNLVFVEWVAHHHYSRLRFEGFAAWAKEKGLPYAIHHLAPINKMEPFAYFAQMRERLSEVIRGLPPACGVFLPSDDRLAFFLEAAQHADKTCPEDFLLIGVDNQGAEPDHPLSAISSINLDTHTIGRTAREVMIRWIQSGVPPKEEILVPPTGVIGRASTQSPLHAAPLVQRALLNIRSQDRCAESVDSLADSLSVSRATLHRQFCEHLGLSPKQVLQEHRVERAHQLLTTTDLPVEDIAVTCGFAHASSFVHAFRQVHACTPGEFRRQHPPSPDAVEAG